MKDSQCKQKCLVYARVVGFYTPVKQWNKAKRDEYKKRKHYEVK